MKCPVIHGRSMLQKVRKKGYVVLLQNVLQNSPKKLDLGIEGLTKVDIHTTLFTKSAFL